MTADFGAVLPGSAAGLKGRVFANRVEGNLLGRLCVSSCVWIERGAADGESTELCHRRLTRYQVLQPSCDMGICR
jgi:hypothetical protein